MAIHTRFTEMFGCRHPLQQAGMGGIATPDLAIAVARAGGLGMLSAGPHLPELLDAVPFGAAVGVNFLAPGTEDVPALEAAAARSPFVECFWGEPDSKIVEIIHAGGARAGWQVGSAREARQADAVRIGTRLMAAHESPAHPHYIDALIRATADDTVLTTAFGDGWPDAPHRVLKIALTAGARLGAQQVWTPDWPDVTYSGVAQARALYAGQSVGAVRERQPAADIVAEPVTVAEMRLTRTVY